MGSSARDGRRRSPPWASARSVRLLLVPAVALLVLWVAIQYVRPAFTLSPVGPSGVDRNGPGAIEVVIVEPSDRPDQFLAGARLAAAEVNRGGGVLGHPMTLVKAPEVSYDETADLQRVVAESMALADYVSKQDNLLAVVGHRSSATAIPASGLYELNDVLFLASHATASSLTGHGFKTVFALQPSNADLAAVMANYALRQGLRRFVLLGDDTNYGSEMVSFFRQWVTLNNGEILYDGSLTSYQRSVERLILFLLDNTLFAPEDIDAVFLTSSSIEDTANFIKAARGLGLTMPILGPEYMYSDLMLDKVGDADMKDVHGVSIYDGDSDRPAATSFRAEFRNEYGVEADLQGALGYDAIKLLTEAAGRAGEIDAGKLSDTLRIMRYDRPFEGVSGRLVFNVNGLVTDTDMFVVRHDGQQFKTVARYTKPLDWDIVVDPAAPPASE